MDPNADNQDFINHINLLHVKLFEENQDYFQILGLPRTATLKDIETAYHKQAMEFSTARIMNLQNPELKQKARAISEKFKRAFEILSNYDRRAEYEKRGFREASAEDEKETDPIEIAKNFYKKAKTLYVRQDFTMAISALEKSIHLDPTKPDPYYLLGVCQSRIPVLKKEAEKNLLKAAELEPWNAEHYAALGMLFYSEKFFAKAESYFRKALSQEPSHVLARKKLEEIVGPEKKPLDSLKAGLKKAFPSIFGRKKK